MSIREFKQPSDVTGKRIGVGEYQQTASLWVRGTLEHDFGVSQYKVDWYMERTDELSHGGATGFTPPKGISFNKIPPDKSIASMLVNHEIDVASVTRAFSRESNIIDRSTHIRAESGDWSKVKPLFPDRIAEAARFVKQHGFVPANHAYAIRGDVARKYPWLAFNLYKAFVAAKAGVARSLHRESPVRAFFRQRICSPKRARFSATIRIPTASKPTGRCWKPSSTIPMSRV